MKNALIGFSGFIGSTLLKQAEFSSLYRSTNICEIENHEFDTVVCAGAPGLKWLANRDATKDHEKIDLLRAYLQTIRCKKFILISTVDVFSQPVSVDESTIVNENGLQPYGLHRRLLEKFVEQHFESHLIVRLPGLIGPGLRKNVIFDLLNNNNLFTIESRSIFQFYPVVNLWYDIQCSINANLNLVHLTAEPISVSDISLLGFGKEFTNELSGQPVEYDMKTRYAEVFGLSGPYQYNVRESIQAIRTFAQTEPIRTQG